MSSGRICLGALCVLAGLIASPCGHGTAQELASTQAGGVDFVRMPGDCYEMGGIDVGIVGEVCLSPFDIGRYEITNTQFNAFRPDHRSGSFGGISLEGGDQPVVNVSWNDAVAYAAWFSRENGVSARLPTEAEWEYAARAGTRTARFWGTSDERAYRFANLRDRAADYRLPDGFEVTAPVGSFEANAAGLHDTIGNVSEWVQDGFIAGADRFGGELQDPVVPAGGPLRVRRGGSFDDPVRIVRVWARDFYAAGFGVPQTGFRLVMEEK